MESGKLVPAADKPVPPIPQDLASAVAQGKVRRAVHSFSRVVCVYHLSVVCAYYKLYSVFTTGTTDVLCTSLPGWQKAWLRACNQFGPPFHISGWFVVWLCAACCGASFRAHGLVGRSLLSCLHLLVLANFGETSQTNQHLTTLFPVPAGARAHARGVHHL